MPQILSTIKFENINIAKLYCVFLLQAIKDGVIEATLDHENGWMQSKENTDIYCTREPQLQFHERIQFCLDMHNQSVKAMRFPPKSYNQDLESAEDRREREAQDLELAKEIAEEDDLIQKRQIYICPKLRATNSI